MEVLGILLMLLFRSFIVLLPLTIVWLSFRRLAKSQGGNTWIYALTCLFALVTTAGLLPWALGLTQTAWMFFVLAAFCPAIWMGVITVCDLSRREGYGDYSDPAEDEPMFKSRQKSRSPAPLVLENPSLPDAPIPVFRHRSEDLDPENLGAENMTSANMGSVSLGPVNTDEFTYSPDPLPPATVAQDQPVADAQHRTTLSIARGMRGRDTSDARRPRLLPPPEMKHLPLAEG